ncbi:malto-oligosyltrehalose synthase [Chelatococcus reniformis]|uniref:4-alpha-glucanotransferase n=1 Tax=Chelatococcus reniformis TaxID=1494448 RepID=A0A916X9V4_9HYPH|nr:malto-oligosyltrehalose synthase [Chelatococcus reniformis]GGC54575.1 hypothetical protein GCM10010994_11870 [Chelatococcus reniformis]
MSDAIVAQLAQLVGIWPQYDDAFGRSNAAPVETQRDILADFGLPTATEAQARDSLARAEQLLRGPLPALIPTVAARPTMVRVRYAAGTTVICRLTDERGAVHEVRTLVGGGAGGGTLTLPALASGYWHLAVDVADTRHEATVISAPRRCFEAPDLADGAKLWGITAQIYSLRSEHDLGIGAFTDVGDAGSAAGKLGASFLGLSPLHALFADDRSKISPYAPSSRLFIDPLYIDPTAIEGFVGSDAARLAAEPDMAAAIAAQRAAPLIDHAAVWAIKAPLLEALWREAGPRAGPGARAFATFRRAQGELLEAHATFEAIFAARLAAGEMWSGEWPQGLRTAASEEVAAFRREHADEIAYRAWLQWQADLQLADAAERAQAAGMGIGLYRDLAVGADRGGSEVWSAPERFGPTLSIGAPPDPIAVGGQNWGLPPFDPMALASQGLAAFRALVAANMRHAGAIRIDHAFQLRRLFLIPQGAPSSAGTYVDFPFDAMMAVLRLESHRHRCLVIAEDLGNGPPGFSDAIMDAGIFSYRVLWFEREGEGRFCPPQDYPPRALSVLTTHDLPTFAGWWRGLDIDLRQTLALFDRDTAEQARASRDSEIRAFAQALAEARLLPDAEPPSEPPIEAAVRYLARTQSSLMGVQLEDVALELNQANLPGLDQGHPNWRRRLAIAVEALAGPGGELAKLASAIAAEGRGPKPRPGVLAAPPPRATYRLQFHKGFTFDDAADIVPYLARLGISHVYASPIHTARPGSTHGYDIVDHATINPELGGEAGFVRLTDALAAHGLGLVLDIVPNHMGVGGADNGWWLSVLEWGELSPHADSFDIDWQRLGAGGRLVVPFLGDRYGEALEKGDLKLAFDAGEGSFSVWHFEHRFPIRPLDFPVILDRALAAAAGEVPPDMLAISERLRAMGEESGTERRRAFPAEAEELKQRLAAAAAASPALTRAIGRAVTLINGVPGVPESFGTLHRLLETQSYRLAHWRVAASDINYRRFFDINGLAGLRIEKPDIFEATHATVFRYIHEGRIQGLRIDHIDGLADPEGYARALQRAVGPGFYIVVEKILEPGESLRPWPIAGTTGYDALNALDGVLVAEANGERFSRIYRAHSDLEGPYDRLLRRAKREVIQNSFASELEGLVSDLKRTADADRRTRDYPATALRLALTEIITRFPVYRTYLTDEEPTPDDRALIDDSVDAAKRRSALPDRSVHDFVRSALLGEIDVEGPGRPDPDLIRRFCLRFQQLTGPVMAKSLEDTLFYRYGRLLALNEVGGDPGHFGISVASFHEQNRDRARAWPDALVATATHDTKRGEDARSRLLALSELPEAWEQALADWRAIARPFVAETDEGSQPDDNDQVLLLQALLGAWPLELLAPARGSGSEAWEALRERLSGFIVKALREAKRYTSWVNPDEDYERAALELMRRVVVPDGPFVRAFTPLLTRLAAIGMVNGLTRTVLKCAVPGVPDIYQGTEFWDLALVDPDNRRPIDYTARLRALDALEEGADAGALLADWRDGRIKQWLLARLLADRAAAPQLYADGDYHPLPATGAKARHCLAFRRSSGGHHRVVVVPRLVATLTAEGTLPLGTDVWSDTRLILPPGRWGDVLTGREALPGPDGGIAVGELVQTLPIAVLRTIDEG